MVGAPHLPHTAWAGGKGSEAFVVHPGGAACAGLSCVHVCVLILFMNITLCGLHRFCEAGSTVIEGTILRLSLGHAPERVWASTGNRLDFRFASHGTVSQGQGFGDDYCLPIHLVSCLTVLIAVWSVPHPTPFFRPHMTAYRVFGIFLGLGSSSGQGVLKGR